MPPKLRLPTMAGKPTPIIVFVKEKFYFSYDTEQNLTDCHRNNRNCHQSSKTLFLKITEINYV